MYILFKRPTINYIPCLLIKYIVAVIVKLKSSTIFLMNWEKTCPSNYKLSCKN